MPGSLTPASIAASIAATVKYLASFMSAINLYWGMDCLLNVVGLLGTSKYSQAATAIFAVLFLGLGAAGLYVTVVRKRAGLGLLVSIGPWILGIVVLFITMMTSSYQ